MACRVQRGRGAVGSEEKQSSEERQRRRAQARDDAGDVNASGAEQKVARGRRGVLKTCATRGDGTSRQTQKKRCRTS